MKTALLLCALANSAIAAPPVVPRITPLELAKLQHDNPMAVMQSPAKGQANVHRPNDQSIIKQSVILCDDLNWTLVPRGAVIFLPEEMKHRVDVKPAGTLLKWTDFLARNQAWLTTNDVSFEQATGKKPLQADRAAFWKKHDKVVIAVHQSGPISVQISNTTQSSSPL